MLDGIVWGMKLENVRPVTRLLALFLANYFGWLGDFQDVEADDPMMEADLTEACVWIGCSTEEITIALAGLSAHGLRDAHMKDGAITFRMPRTERVVRPRVKADPLIFIYVMTVPGATKIGITRNLEARQASIQSTNPHEPVEIAFRARGAASVMLAIERDAHLKFADRRIRNEWFNAPAAEVIASLKVMLGERGIHVA